jgi:hypothetical protein
VISGCIRSDRSKPDGGTSAAEGATTGGLGGSSIRADVAALDVRIDPVSAAACTVLGFGPGAADTSRCGGWS